MYKKESVETFLKEQSRLYDEPMAESYEEAEEFLHPGPIHTKNAMELRDEKSEWLLNTDGQIGRAHV